MPRSSIELKAGRRRVPLSNPDKVLYPSSGFAKRDLADYYLRIAPVILPHLRGRPLTVKRYPDGVTGQFFYQKHSPDHRPDWVTTAVVQPEPDDKKIRYTVVTQAATLAWLSSLAGIELHVPMGRARTPTKPTAMVFDLDPGPGTGLPECARVAVRLRDTLARLDLQSWTKTSGSKGLQLYVPLNTPATAEETKEAARQLGDILARETPREVTTTMAKAARKGRVFIDWSQNDAHKTTVCVYSLRATARPQVSTPLQWEEVERAASGARGARRKAAGKDGGLVFDPSAVLARVEKHGDLFAPVLTLRQSLRALRR